MKLTNKKDLLHVASQLVQGDHAKGTPAYLLATCLHLAERVKALESGVVAGPADDTRTDEEKAKEKAAANAAREAQERAEDEAAARAEAEAAAQAAANAVLSYDPLG